MVNVWHNRDIAPFGAISGIVNLSQSRTTTPLIHLDSLGENFAVNNCGMQNSSENTLTQKRMCKSLFRTSHTYCNCLLESSLLENPSALTGWWSGIGIANTANKSFSERIIHILKSLSNYS